MWKRKLNKLLYKITEAIGGQVAVASKLAYQMSVRGLFTISLLELKGKEKAVLSENTAFSFVPRMNTNEDELFL